MITSKLTPQAQTTIPEAVREALHLQAGDEIAYAIEGDRVMLTKMGVGRPDDPFELFDEWRGEADTAAYGKL